MGNAAGGWLSDRLGRTRVLALGLGASALVSGIYGLLGGLPLVLLVAVTLAYGVVLADERVGSALSFQSLAGFSTTVVSPVVFGLALDRGGYPLAFPTLAGGALLGLVSVAALVRLRGEEPADTPGSDPERSEAVDVSDADD